MLVSIVVPVYNVQDLLANCLDSLLNQTYTDLEIILVNDGSTDASGSLCEQYAKKDARIRVFHQRNSGQSASRNFGVKQAQGDWILFQDSDDYLEPYAVELLTKVQQFHPEAVVIGQLADTENLTTRSALTVTDDELARLTPLSSDQALVAMLYNKEVTVSPCAKLYPKSLLLAHPFPEGMIYEDFWVASDHAFGAQQHYVLPQVIYHYYQRPGSTVNRSYSSKQLDFFKAVNHQSQQIEENGQDKVALHQALGVKTVYGSLRLAEMMMDSKNLEDIGVITSCLRPLSRDFYRHAQVSFKSKCRLALFLLSARLYQHIRCFISS